MFSKLKANPKIALFLWLIFFSGGCMTIYNPATSRKETYFINTKWEIALGRDMDKQIQQRLKILKDPLAVSRLETIGQKITAVSDRKDLTYAFRVVNDKEFNAFAIPGGFIYVNSGLMQAANDDELAAVIAHETGHIAARHGVKRLQVSLGYQILFNVALAATRTAANQQIIAKAVDTSFNLVSLGYSRQDEFLADRLAIRYSQRAGFNPQGMVTFFEKLKEEARKKGPNFRIVFLSSHPPIEERIKNAKKEIASINPKI
jgi:predicted Zn-dependent protease